MKLTKNWYKSKTIVAIIWLLVLLLNKHFGIILEDSEIFQLLSMITEVLLSILAIYGRATATQKIK